MMISKRSLFQQAWGFSASPDASVVRNMTLYRWIRGALLLILGAGLGLIVFVGVLKPCKEPRNNIRLSGESTDDDSIHITNNIATLYRWQDPVAEQPDTNKGIYPNRTNLHDDLPTPRYAKTFYAECGKICHSFVRALRELGWIKVDSRNEGRLLYTAETDESWFEIPKGGTTPRIKSWQRYSHLPSTQAWQQTEGFYDAVLETSTYLPEMYRLHNHKERKRFRKIMNSKGAETNPLLVSQPWVLEDYGEPHGLSFMDPLPDDEAIPESGYVSRYICHPILWGPSTRAHGRKFDVRVFFFVASLDPLLVFYHDGYVQTSRYPYQEGDYTSSLEVVKTHLMDFGKFRHDHGKQSFEDLERMIQIWSRNKRANPKATNLQHIRNQMKEAIVQIIGGLRSKAFNLEANGNQDGFELFAADFVIDQELNVWLMRAHSQTDFDEDMYSTLELGHRMYSGMIRILEDVWTKQATPGRSILPVVGTGTWELVVAGGTTADVIFQYNDYKRVKAIKKTKPCDPLVEPKKKGKKKNKA